jgi:hypothetical protein
VAAEAAAAREAEEAAERERQADELAAAESPSIAESFADLGNDPVPAPEPIETTEVVEVLDREPGPDRGQSVDTAALLRELASLGGFGDGPSDAPTTTSSPVRSSPVTKDTEKKKKKGLFGR